jgi:hypothetical protein
MAKRKSPRTHSAEFKLNVVLEAYANGNFSDTAARHGIHITQINNWKRQLLTRGKEIFEYGQAVGRNLKSPFWVLPCIFLLLLTVSPVSLWDGSFPLLKTLNPH